MSVDLADLVPRLKASLSVPGSPSLFNFDDDLEGDWAGHLVNAFWQARLADLFTDYRVVPDTEEVEPIDPTDPDLPEEVHQIIVMFGALIAIESRFMALSNTRFKSGEQEAEVQRPLQLLKALLDHKRAELDDIKDGVLNGNGTTSATTVAFYDMVSLKHQQIELGYTSWIN